MRRCLSKTYTYKVLKRFAGKALHKYNMIQDGDRVLVGLSGGKDSLTLMWLLNERLSRIPIKYELFPVYIDPGFENGFRDELEEYCKNSGYDLKTELTDYGLRSHSSENRENPCFLCSMLRRKRLFELADSLGCSKLALGHHKDDIIETLFLNIFYSGEISAMSPSQTFFKNRFTVIRPLSFLDEETIIRFSAEQNFPEFINPCPSSRISKRQEIKDMLNGLYKKNRKIKGNIFRAMQHVNKEYLL